VDWLLYLALFLRLTTGYKCMFYTNTRTYEQMAQEPSRILGKDVPKTRIQASKASCHISGSVAWLEAVNPRLNDLSYANKPVKGRIPLYRRAPSVKARSI
jgi:hypothetical protein